MTRARRRRSLLAVAIPVIALGALWIASQLTRPERAAPDTRITIEAAEGTIDRVPDGPPPVALTVSPGAMDPANDGGATAPRVEILREEPAADPLRTHGGIVVLFLTTVDDEPAGSGWTALVTTYGSSTANGEPLATASAAVDTATGIGIVERVLPGTIVIAARHTDGRMVSTAPEPIKPNGTVTTFLTAQPKSGVSSIKLDYSLGTFGHGLASLRRDAPIEAELHGPDGFIASTLEDRLDFKGDGPLTLRINDPRFLPVTVEGVLHGQIREIPLVGAASVEVEVVTSHGDPVDDYRLFGLLTSGLRSGGRSERLPMDDQVTPEEGPRRHTLTVPAGCEFKLTVRTDARGETEVVVPGLHRGARERVVLKLPDYLTAEVTVVRGAARKPVADALVHLVTFDPPVERGDADPGDATEPGEWKPVIRIRRDKTQHHIEGRRIHMSAKTDAEGRVTLGASLDADPGPWFVYYEGGEVLTPQVVELTGERATIHAGGFGSLEIRNAKAEASAPFIQLELQRAGAAEHAPAVRISPDPVEPNVYRVGSIPEGRYSVSLLTPILEDEDVVADWDGFFFAPPAFESTPLGLVNIFEGQVSYLTTAH